MRETEVNNIERSVNHLKQMYSQMDEERNQLQALIERLQRVKARDERISWHELLAALQSHKMVVTGRMIEVETESRRLSHMLPSQLEKLWRQS